MRKLSNRRTLAAIAAVAIFMSPQLASAQGPPQIPATYYGTVTIDGAPAREGAVVRAFISGRDCTQSGAKGVVHGAGVARYVITVVHLTQQPGCGDESQEVVFRVDGVEATQRVRWVAGPRELDLTLSAGSSPGASVTPIPPGSAVPPTTEPADDNDSEDSASWLLIGAGLALAAVGAAAAVLFWRKRQGKG